MAVIGQLEAESETSGINSFVAELQPRRTMVRVSGLSIGYASARGEELVVLENLHFSIAEGEFVCIVGASGCGKSTLLNALAGFEPYDRGEVVIDGEPVRGPDPRRLMVFQERTLFPWMTVQENVEFGLSELDPDERSHVARRFIELVELRGRERAYPHQLSGGMCQRAEIARALAANPRVVFMDEPFSGLDFFTRQRLRKDLVRIWRATQKTIVFVTHDLDEAIELADTILVLRRGQPVGDGIVSVRLPRPRGIHLPDYMTLRTKVFQLLDSSQSDADSM